MKFAHIVAHSLTNHVISELAYMYTIDKRNAQLISIMILAN